MKYAVVLCALMLVVALVSAKPAESTTPKWDLETCESRAVIARKESKQCRDYQCVQHSYGLVLDGIDCKSYSTD